MKVFDGKDGKAPFQIGLVASRFNIEITKPMVEGALARLKELGFSDSDISLAWVPGAVELPLAAQRLAQLGIYEAIVCLGAVIRGETDHYQYVCEQASQGCQQVALQNDIPIIFGVLTTENEEQAKDRIGGKHGHKGKEAIDAAVEMATVIRHIG